MLNGKKSSTFTLRIVKHPGLAFFALLVFCVVVELQAWRRPPMDWRLGLLVGRDLLLGLFAIGTVAFVAADFVRAVYGLRTRSEGYGFLRQRLFATSRFKTYLLIKEGMVAADASHPLIRVGGPGQLRVSNDSAVVLEKNGKLTRVVKSGFVMLGAFERVWDVVDLRPHRWVYDVSAMSKDGIPVTCQVDVTFQIDDGRQTPSEAEPFPATEQAIFRAVTSKWVREAERSEDDQLFDWARRAMIGMTESTLRDLLATYSLDQILGPIEPNQDNCRAELLDKLRGELHNSFPDLGVKVMAVELGDIKVDDSIAQSRIESWQSSWRRREREREAEGEAEYLRYVEAAKAQAKADRDKESQLMQVAGETRGHLDAVSGTVKARSERAPWKVSPSRRKHLSRLREKLATHLSDGELRNLCQDMEIEYEALPGQGKEDKARELVAYCNRRELVPELIEELCEQRPEVTWKDASEEGRL